MRCISQTLALLYHHVCFYKHHKAKFAIGVVCPLIFPLIIHLIISQGQPEIKDTIRNPTEIPLFPHKIDEVIDRILSNRYVRYRNWRPRTRYGNCVVNSTQGLIQPGFIKPNNHVDRKIFGCMSLMADIVNAGNRGRRLDRNTTAARLKTQELSRLAKFGEALPSGDASLYLGMEKLPLYLSIGYEDESNMTLMLMGSILFYPNTSKSGSRVMGRVRSYLSRFMKVPELLARKTGVDKDSVSKCFGDPSKRIQGFRTREDAVKYAKKYLIPSRNIQPFCRLTAINLWGIVGFTSDSQSVNYIIVQDPRVEKYETGRGLQLQSLIESAVLETRGGSEVNGSRSRGGGPVVPKRRLSLAPLPSLCYHRKADVVFKILPLATALLIFLSFMIFPTHCGEVLVYERTSRFWRHLRAFGVTQKQSIFSWALFFALMSLPLWVAFAAMVRTFTFPLVNFIAFAPLFLLVVCFWFAQLGFVTFAANFLDRPWKVLPIALAAAIPPLLFVHFYVPSLAVLHGSKLYVIHALCLIHVVPLFLGCQYLYAYPSLWLDMDSSFWSGSALENDDFGGFWVPLVWLACDAVFYFLLAWYFDNLLHSSPDGPRLSYFFLFTKSYWFPPSHISLEENTETFTRKSRNLQNTEVVEDSRKDARIIVDKISKEYPRKKVGVREISMAIYEDEITAVLGKPGCGKSSLFNCISGRCIPSSGSIKVDGWDMGRARSRALEKMAYLPQESFLHESLCTTDHVRFFGWLKGADKRQIATTLEQLNKMRIDLNIDVRSMTSESRRILEVVLTYLGVPKYIVLDDPTAGLQNEAKTKVWNYILENRKRSTAVLFTPSVDEANFLADRIMIMRHGKLKCFGTPSYLSSVYGSGMRLVFSGKEISKISGIVTRFCKETCVSNEQIELEDELIKVDVPKPLTDKVLNFIETCERAIDSEHMKLDIRCTVQEFGLHDVFQEVNHGSANIASELGGFRIPEKPEDSSRKPVTGCSRLVQQVRGLLWKRMSLAGRDPSIIRSTLFLPICWILVVATLSFLIREQPANSTTPITLNNSNRQGVWFFKGPSNQSYPLEFVKAAIQGENLWLNNSGLDAKLRKFLKFYPQNHSACKCNSKCSKESKKMAETRERLDYRDLGYIYGLNGVNNISNWIFSVNSSFEPVIGGYVLSNRDIDQDELVILSKTDQMPAMLNEISNIFLRFGATSGSMESTKMFGSHEKAFLDRIEGPGASRFLSSTIFERYLYLIAMIASAYATVSVVLSESDTDFKKFQFCGGANRAVYHLTNLLFDMVCYMTMLLSFICILTFVLEVPARSIEDIIGPFVLFGFSWILFAYILSCTSWRMATKGTILQFSIGFCLVVAPICAVFGNQPVLCKAKCVIDHVIKGLAENACGAECKASGLGKFARSVNYLLGWMPPYILLQASASSVQLQLFQDTAKEQLSDGKVIARLKDIDLSKLIYGEDATNMQMLASVHYSVWIVVYLTLLMLVEYFPCVCPPKCCAKPFEHIESNNSTTGITVAEEIQKTSKLDIFQKYPMVLSNFTVPLAKQGDRFYGSSGPIIGPITLSITKPEIFGVCGLSSEDRETLFEGLTGKRGETSGSCYIGGFNIETESVQAEEGLMFVPQKSILPQSLTPSNLVALFSRFLGVPSNALPEQVGMVLAQMGLLCHAKEPLSDLEEGSRKGLQVALALLGRKKLIVINDPTTGLTTTGRKYVWENLRAAKENGSSVVLISSETKECEKSCDRVAYFKDGEIVRFGAETQKPEKNGQYKIQIHLENDGSLEKSRLLAKKFLQDRLGESTQQIQEHGCLIAVLLLASSDVKASHLCRLKMRFQETFKSSQCKILWENTAIDSELKF